MADRRNKNSNKSLKVLKGDIGLIKMLISGDFNEKYFLAVPKGKYIAPAYDNELILKISDTANF